jgi:glycosyltransferase involved in cell wall biosynthesis
MSMISIIVNFYNNRREARNTLHSLTRGYQRGAQQLDFEVLAVDNGSTDPLTETDVRAFGPEFEYHFVTTTSRSPAAAINAACRSARGDHLLVLIDGAHILSPGMYALAERAFACFCRPFLATAMFHLGPKPQNESVLEGYNQRVEDQLLANSKWRDNGYRLYDIAGGFGDPGGNGWFGSVNESGCFGIRREDFLAIGGFDERFTSPGGGLVALDLFQRAVAQQKWEYVMLLGEGSFHQFHGGVASNAPTRSHPWREFDEEYTRLHGKPYARVPRRPLFFGGLPDEALASARNSIQLRMNAIAPPTAQ